ncbi:N-acetylmuramoyl-L-alanine amidase [Desulfosporosinus sp. SB140]|uniref:N-acetylmuramoyl-L-alanine amidase n=1 Tax=Desulfosporosinus paludis TaxID=3115649 RepID=UPI00388F6D72
MTYNIQQNLIPGLPKEPYTNGHYIGVIAHSTDVYYDTPDSERNYEQSHWKDAFVHFFVGSGKIEQVADTSCIAYGAGKTANHLGYAQVELCQTYDSAQFAQDYAMYVWLLAKLLHDRGLGMINGVTLMSHAEVSAKWGETDHTDPIDYLASHGKSWANVVADVAEQYKGMDVVELDFAVVYFTVNDFTVAKDIADLHGGCAMFCRNGNASVNPDAKKAAKVFNVGGPALGWANEVYLSGNKALDTVVAVANAYTDGKLA